MLAGALIGAGRGPNRYCQGPKQVLPGAKIGASSAPEVLARPEVCRGTGTGGPEVLVMAERGPKEVLAKDSNESN